VNDQRPLTVGEVRKANDGAVAIARQCLRATEGRWDAAEALSPTAVEGSFNLVNALRKDPDTRYRAPGTQAAESMREITVLLVGMLTSPCSSVIRQQLLTALNGLPR
jgi:hypothetical protein